MASPMSREEAWQRVSGPWDILIIGGGITGAGILRLAMDMGLKTLLVDRNDFAWGTSSRSGKLVHGGLRYLRQGQFIVTRHSVGERERLLREAPGLVEPLDFLLPVYTGQGRLRAAYRLGLGIYDLLAGRRTRYWLDREGLLKQAPAIAGRGLEGGMGYQDACADDARLVLRLIFEAVADGGLALNHAPVENLLFDRSGRVCGAVIRDRESGRTAEAAARAVINATGAWADKLRGRIGRSPVIRPLRGSHLIFSRRRLPVSSGVSFRHPRDGRPLYVIPWEGVTLLGTTDLDCRTDIDADPSIHPSEVDYLLEAAGRFFPSLKLEAADAISSFSGVRPVLGSGKRDPSRESRDMVVMDEGGLLTVTGGKLTTFRLLALKALARVGKTLSLDLSGLGRKRVYRHCDFLSPGNPGQAGERLAGRYGQGARQLVDGATENEMREIPGTVYLWAELKHAARHEMAVHLDDLLLRRLRLGLVLPDGGAVHLDRIKETILPAMGWDEARWLEEWASYQKLWRQSCLPGGKESVWR